MVTSNNLIRIEAPQAFADFVHKETGAHIDPVADGKPHRFPDPEGRKGNKSGWYVLYDDDHPTGIVGNWRTGLHATWRADKTSEMTPEEKARNAATIAKLREERRLKKETEEEAAAGRAMADWRGSKPASPYHGYLLAKKIPPLGLREASVADSILLVPLVDVNGRLWSLQRIWADGAKRFLSRGRITGLFFPIGINRVSELANHKQVYICEGAATGITCHQVFKAPVLAAMNAGNLLPVALEIRAAFPSIDIVIAADNDHRSTETTKNVGLDKGEEAAAAVGGGLLWPDECCDDCRCTDYNDYVNCARAI